MVDSTLAEFLHNDSINSTILHAGTWRPTLTQCSKPWMRESNFPLWDVTRLHINEWMDQCWIASNNNIHQSHADTVALSGPRVGFCQVSPLEAYVESCPMFSTFQICLQWTIKQTGISLTAPCFSDLLSSFAQSAWPWTYHKFGTEMYGKWRKQELFLKSNR